ncbi:MAG: Pimeloyl-ACP methyl ester carboxylesterase, partial [Planctomycetaceae bacterium]|nr:Pimeloyl-ACP methyl ester carboxylesterase [Planctomycetaceae bacterium]
MFATPAAVIGSFFRGLLAIAIIVGGIYLTSQWYQSLPERVSVVRTRPADSTDHKLAPPAQDQATDWHLQTPLQRMQAWRPGLDRKSFMLLGGIVCLLMS